MKRRLQAYIAAQKVGELTLNSERQFEFQYASEWLHSNHNFPISLSMPLSIKSYKGKKIDAFFQFLTRTADNQNIEAEGVIEKLKLECPGGLSFFEEDKVLESGRGKYSLINQSAFQTLINARLVDGQIVRYNEFGQKVLSIVTHQGNLYVSKTSSPSMYFLKTGSDRLPNLIENEYICMQIAAALGLRVGRVKLQFHNNQTYLLCERTDRVYGTTQLTVVHQESFSQSLGATKTSKKQLYSYKNCFKLIHHHSLYPARDKLQLVKLIIFNLIIGNTEFDCEKLFLIIGLEAISLAKFSGLFSTILYDSYYRSFKMPISGSKKLEELTIAKLKAFCQDIEISYKFFCNELKDMSHEFIPEMIEIIKKLNSDSSSTPEALERFKQRIEDRCRYIQTVL